MSIIQINQQFENENLPVYRNSIHGLYALQSPSPEPDSEEIAEKQYPSGAEDQSLRFFNPDLAIDVQKKLKAKKPDITAAFILRYLHSWKKAACKGFTGSRVRNAVYRSLEQIQDNLQWMDKVTVQRAIGRLEKAFPKDFKVDRLGSKVTNYLISDRLTRDYFGKRARNLSVRVNDAAKHGVLEAVLIRNLEYKTQPENVSNPVTDDIGRIYGEMSAMALTAPRESRNADNEVKRAILPFGRQAVQESISNLKLKEVFIEHHDRRGFYTLDRGQNGDKSGCRNAQNRVSSNATELSPNATVESSNATDLSPNATVSSVQIERERNGYRNEIESDNKTFLLSPLARAAQVKFENESSDIECLNLSEAKFELLEDPIIEVSFDPSITRVPPSIDSTTVNLPRIFKDEFPNLMIELNSRLQKLQNARKMPIEHVCPNHLPFDYTAPCSGLLWLENELFLNPITEQPLGWSNFEEQIDVAVYELEDNLCLFRDFSKADMLEFRGHFKTHEGLSIPMVRKMLERISDVIVDPEYHRTQRGEFDHYYFAKRIKTLKNFNRYFKQLFRETFAPYLKDNGEYRFEANTRLRWWPDGELFNDDEFEYPLSDTPENTEEPFRTILEDAVVEEREKVRVFEQTMDIIQDAQETEIEEKTRKPGVELLPTKEKLMLLGPSPACTKPRVPCVVEEYSVMWHLMETLGVEVIGENSRFPVSKHFKVYR